ncbi:MAG: hypothetical protein R3343_13005 [Nitriliruptorales bacterium]|nr:hypothetical protein [Nitriliruptorales bacterium]
MQHLIRTASGVLRRLHDDEAGFTTAELLGNAALGVVALVVIWGLLQALGVDLIAMIRDQLLASNTP